MHTLINFIPFCRPCIKSNDPLISRQVDETSLLFRTSVLALSIFMVGKSFTSVTALPVLSVALLTGVAFYKFEKRRAERAIQDHFNQLNQKKEYNGDNGLNPFQSGKNMTVGPKKSIHGTQEVSLQKLQEKAARIFEGRNFQIIVASDLTSYKLNDKLAWLYQRVKLVKIVVNKILGVDSNKRIETLNKYKASIEKEPIENQSKMAKLFNAVSMQLYVQEKTNELPLIFSTAEQANEILRSIAKSKQWIPVEKLGEIIKQADDSKALKEILNLVEEKFQSAGSDEKNQIMTHVLEWMNTKPSIYNPEWIIKFTKLQYEPNYSAFFKANLNFSEAKNPDDTRDSAIHFLAAYGELRTKKLENLATQFLANPTPAVSETIRKKMYMILLRDYITENKSIKDIQNKIPIIFDHLTASDLKELTLQALSDEKFEFIKECLQIPKLAVHFKSEWIESILGGISKKIAASKDELTKPVVSQWNRDVYNLMDEIKKGTKQQFFFALHTASEETEYSNVLHLLKLNIDSFEESDISALKDWFGSFLDKLKQKKSEEIKKFLGDLKTKAEKKATERVKKVKPRPEVIRDKPGLHGDFWRHLIAKIDILQADLQKPS